jgi:hypothetical protein
MHLEAEGEMMKVAVKVDPSLKAGECSYMSKQVTKMECGLAFARFSLSKDRIERNNLKTIPQYDVRSGLNTTAGVVSMVESSIPEHLKPQMKAVRAAAKRLVTELVKGPKQIKAQDAPKYILLIDKIQTKLTAITSRIEKSCR